MKNIFVAALASGLLLSFVPPIVHNPRPSHITGKNRTITVTDPMTNAVNREMTRIEKLVLYAAEAMPEEKYNFSPADMKIKGSLMEGIRTFAGQLKHLATDNYDMWCAITGDPLPAGIVDVNGPSAITSKKDILAYLKGSFEEGHKAIASLTTANCLDPIPFRGDKLARIDLTYWALTHSCDHYGQMIMYLRLCGIPPTMYAAPQASPASPHG